MATRPRTIRLKQVELSYIDQGARDAPVAVLLHGMTDSWRSFQPVLGQLPDTIRAVAPSQRGHGDSAKPERGYRIADFVADLVALLDGLGIERVVVAGHSSHGLVAQRMAIDHPGRTAGIVLISAFGTVRGETALEDFVATQIDTLADPIDVRFVDTFQAGTCAKPLPAAFRKSVVDEAMKVPARVWQAGFRSVIETDHSAELSRIAVPTLLVWGDRDAIVGRGRQDALMAAIPRTRLKVYEGVGHSPHWEEPGRFAADLSDFVLGRR